MFMLGPMYPASRQAKTGMKPGFPPTGEHLKMVASAYLPDNYLLKTVLVAADRRWPL